MHWLDVVLLILFILAAIWGAKSGFVKQVARAVALVLGIYLCIHLHEPVAMALQTRLDGFSDFGAKITSFVVIFLGVVLVCWLLASWLSKMLEAAQLKPLDRLLGAGVGLIKAGLFVGVILWGVAHFAGDRLPGPIADSKMAPIVLKGMEVVRAAVPEKQQERIEQSIQKAKKVVKEKAVEQVEPEKPFDPLTDPIPYPFDREEN